MPRFVRLSLIAWLILAGGLRAQYPVEDPPRPYKPLHPTTKAELDRLEAIKLFAVAIKKERDNRLLEATHLYEEAVRLDPKSPAPLRALVPLYLALDRVEDAFIVCRKVLELDPNDHDTGYLYGRQLRAQNRPKEALEVLTRVVAMPKLGDHLDLKAQVHHDLAILYE